MYKTIVVPLALDHGLGCRSMAVARALRDEGGEIHAIHVIEPVPSFVRHHVTADMIAETQKAAADGIAERIGDVRDAESVVLGGQAGREIVAFADRIGADCIVIASHKPGLQDYFLGSTAGRVVRHASCSVHVIR